MLSSEHSMNTTVVSYPAKNPNPDQKLQAGKVYPVTLKFEEVVYKVSLTYQGSWTCCSGQESGKGMREKTILNGVTGLVCPGEILAMLGPSGSGKTTLLNALGCRLAKNKLSGKITYNGLPFSSTIKRKIGFVAQDDVMYPHLTVSETLIFTALLRLPKTLSKAEKVQHAEHVMAELGLTRVAHSVIGGPYLRGVSGGEKKRVSIGQEMLVNPSLLLLDEPTSGLDSTNAQRIMTTLKRLAGGGRAIVTTIHQPASRLYHMFDKVILLSEGCPIYHGKASDALGYFDAIGFASPLSVNPADLLLDLANGIAPNSKQNPEEWRSMAEEQKAVREELISILTCTSLNLQTSLLFFFSVFWGFYPLYNAVFTFPQERSMLIKERSSGMYRLSTYFLARTAADLPMELALPTAFVIIIYWMGGLDPNPLTFFLSLLVVLYSVLVAQSLGLAIGAILIDDIKQATTLASVTTLVFLIAGGYYVQQIPAFIVWLKYLSYSFYCYKLLIGIHYHVDDQYECAPDKMCSVIEFPAIRSVGLDNVWVDVCIMGLMLVGYRLVAYCALHRMKPASFQLAICILSCFDFSEAPCL